MVVRSSVKKMCPGCKVCLYVIFYFFLRAGTGWMGGEGGVLGREDEEEGGDMVLRGRGDSISRGATSGWMFN